MTFEVCCCLELWWSPEDKMCSKYHLFNVQIEKILPFNFWKKHIHILICSLQISMLLLRFLTNFSLPFWISISFQATSTYRPLSLLYWGCEWLEKCYFLDVCCRVLYIFSDLFSFSKSFVKPFLLICSSFSMFLNVL